MSAEAAADIRLTVDPEITADKQDNASAEKGVHIQETPVRYESIDFDGPDDPENPVNWSNKYKWTLVLLLSIMSLASNFGTIMCAPALPQILADFHTANQLYGTILVSIWELGEAFGPLLIAPFSEKFGRAYAYSVTNILFILCSIMAAISVNINMLIAFRFFNGVGVACVVLNPGIIGDLFIQEERGRAMALINLPPLVGPVAGPIIGGYVAQAIGWRWVFWICTIMAGTCGVLFLLFFRETYKVRILQKKAERLRKHTSNVRIHSTHEKPGLTPIKLSITRPLHMFRSPIISFMAIYMALVYGYIYVFFTTLATVFETEYHFPRGPVGLTFLGIGVGICCGVFLCGITSDWYVKKRAKDGVLRPEDRLPPLLLGSFCLVAGILTYGWTAQTHVFWIVPIIATAFVGFGLVTTMIPIASYLVDAYPLYAASAMAAVAVLRCIVGATLPLAGPPLFDALGLGWGCSLLAFIALVFVPLVLVLLRYGEQIRGWSKLETMN